MLEDRAGRYLFFRITSNVNNIFSVLSADHQLIYFPSVTGNTPFQIDTTRYTLADWQAGFAHENHSIQQDPKFTNAIAAKIHTPGHPNLSEGLAEVNEYLNSFKMTESSPRGLGEIHGADSYYDFKGTKRHLNDHLVDHGALEYLSTDTLSPAAPTNLKAK